MAGMYPQNNPRNFLSSLCLQITTTYSAIFLLSTNTSILSLVDEGRGADVIPHLAGDHGEHEEEGDEGPGRPVVEELQIVAPQVQQPADQGRQHHHSNRSCNRVNPAEDTFRWKWKWPS